MALSQEEALALVLDAFKFGMIQGGLEARDFAMWMSEQEDIANICELGTAAGGTLWLMGQVAKPGLRISMDMPWETRDIGNPDLDWHMTVRDRFKAAMPDLVEVLGQIHDPEQKHHLEAILGETRLDLLMIDADHSYAGTKQHVEMYGPLVRPGGFIAFHDLVNGWPCGDYVKTELFPKYKHWVFEEKINTFGIGVIQV